MEGGREGGKTRVEQRECVVGTCCSHVAVGLN